MKLNVLRCISASAASSTIAAALRACKLSSRANGMRTRLYMLIGVPLTTTLANVQQMKLPKLDSSTLTGRLDILQNSNTQTNQRFQSWQFWSYRTIQMPNIWANWNTLRTRNNSS